MFVVYKIVRDDGQLYIGTTSQNRIDRRMSQHKKHKRFKDHNFVYEIIYESESYDDVQSMEEKFIEEFDTFYGGLNETIDGSGNHLSPKFTTMGYVYSNESREKMSANHWSKHGKFEPWNKGKKNCFTQDTLNAMSKKRKGVRPKGTTKLTEDLVRNIRTDFVTQIDLGTLTQTIRNGKPLQVGDTMANGRVLTYENAFCKEYAFRYGVTRQAIYNIIKNTGWTDVH